MNPEERKRAIEKLANEIVNKMSLAEMMAIVVEKARIIAEQKVDGDFTPYSEEDQDSLRPKANKSFNFMEKIKKLFMGKKKHKGFATKKMNNG